jgi:hypothetical protein
MQTQLLKSLHLDTIMYNVAKTVYLAATLQRTLRLAYSPYYTEAEA